MAAKRSVSKRTRFEVFKRDGFTCQYCGSHPPQSIMHVDHVMPVSKGGSNHIDNLITACQSCNLGKSNVLLSSVPKSINEKASEIKEREAQIAGYYEILALVSDRKNREAWDVVAEIESDPEIDSYNRQMLLSIKRFLDLIPFMVVKESAEIAASHGFRSANKRFKYFCGICWNRVRESGNGKS